MTIRRSHVLGIGLAAGCVALVLSARSLQSAPQQVPGMMTSGSAPVQVTNQPAVQVVNQPTVQAMQAGAWRVAVPDGVTLAKGATVAFEGPPFLEVNRRYVMRWGAGLTGTYTVFQIQRGWALVGSGSTRLWVNTALAVAIEEAK
jgi:hypothetical protein